MSDRGSYYDEMMTGPVGAFGKFLIQEGYNQALTYAIKELENGWHGDESEAIRLELADLTDEQKRAIVLLVGQAVVAGIHDVLYAVVSDSDPEGLALRFNGADLEPLSDGLHGDLLNWLVDFGLLPYDADTLRLRLSDVPSFPELCRRVRPTL